MTAKRSKDFSGELTDYLRKQALAYIDRDRNSLRGLAKLAEIDAAALSRFLAGKSGLTLESADRLAGALKLRLSKR